MPKQSWEHIADLFNRSLFRGYIADEADDRTEQKLSVPMSDQELWSRMQQALAEVKKKT